MARATRAAVWLIASLVLVGCASQPVGQLPVALESVEHAFERSTVRLERGLLSVPESRANGGTQIQIEIARFPRAANAPADTPPVFFLPGGPGFPGVDAMLQFGGTEALVALVTSITDLVVVGQRGIGASEPSLDCRERPQVDDAASRDAVFAAMRAAAEQCRVRWLEQGVDLAAYNVIEAAADVRDVARAFGYDQIQLLGGSFGSHWSMAVMRYQPQIVSRALLHGLEGPDHTYDSPTGVLQAVTQFAAEADQLDEAPAGGWLASLGTVIAQLDAEPVEVTVDSGSGPVALTLDGDAVRATALGVRGHASSRRGMGTWPGDVATLLKADYEGLGQATLARMQQGLPGAAFFALDCASGITATREAELNADPAQAVLGNLSGFYQAICPVWQVDLGDGFRTGFATPIPTLLVHGTYDTSTPYSNVMELRSYFAKHHLVTIRGGSHGALNEGLSSDAEFAEAVARFLASGELQGIPDDVTLAPLEFAPTD